MYSRAQTVPVIVPLGFAEESGACSEVKVKKRSSDVEQDGTAANDK